MSSDSVSVSVTQNDWNQSKQLWQKLISDIQSDTVDAKAFLTRTQELGVNLFDKYGKDENKTDDIYDIDDETFDTIMKEVDDAGGNDDAQTQPKKYASHNDTVKAFIKKPVSY